VTDAAERLVNLALFLASQRSPVTAEECRSAGLGYPDGQDDAAFIRMFERDKDALRASGLVIDVNRDEGTEAYRLDANATFARPVDLAEEERATVRAVAAALAHSGFPFSEDLARALGKIGTAGPAEASGAVPDDTGESGRAAAVAEAVFARKTVVFDYTNARGECRQRTVDPYGIFSRSGHWYLTGHDHDAVALRTFALRRARDLAVNTARPRTPDFERPADFDITEHRRLPFQYGSEAIDAVVRFEPDAAWRAERLALGRGSLVEQPDGSVLWHIDARDLNRLARWIVEEGPGIGPLEPPALVERVRGGLARVVDIHG
jgi:proteasome accessory factor B